MAKRKYVFDEFDRTGFQEALDTMMTNRACYNNFVSYLQQLYEKENNSFIFNCHSQYNFNNSSRE